MKNIYLLFTLLFVAGLNNSYAQNTWTKKADFAGNARTSSIGFTIGNKGYIGTGVNYVSGKDYKDFWEYDPTTNAWTQKADFGGGLRNSAVGFNIDNKGYVGTGSNIGTNQGLSDFWEYEPVSNSWTKKADFAGGLRIIPVGFSIGSKGYVGTGHTVNVRKKDFWEYDPGTDIWTQKADFGGGIRNGAVGFSIGSKGYVGTGHNGNSPTKDFWEYDPTTNTWTQKADFEGGIRELAVGFSIGSKGYVGTGSNGNSQTKDFWEYDPTTDIWTQKANFNGVEREFARGFSIVSKGYIGMGVHGTYPGSYPSDFWEYTPDACNGLTVYADADSDGYGNTADSLFVADCTMPNGYVQDSTDCNDTDPNIHPGATETPGDGKDNNCNGQVDENNALSFDGVDDYIQIAEKVINNLSSGTIECWIYLHTNNEEAICAKQWDGYNSYAVFTVGFYFGGNTPGIPGRLYFHGHNNVNNASSKSNLDTGQWYHVAVTFSSSECKFYINGNLDNTVSGNYSVPNQVAVTAASIGAWLGDGGGRYLNGKIDEFRLWKVARTQSQIQTSMRGAICGSAKGLTAYYPFNQGIAGGNNSDIITADDITSNNNDGTLTNFKLTGSKSNWVNGVPGLNDFAIFYQDADGDTYGNVAVSIHASVCNPPAGYVTDSSDCNDADSSVHPGATEVNNGVDDNCNGLIDEGNWKKETDFVRAGRYSAVAFTYGGKVYFGLGKTASGKFMKDFWEYDPSTNVWTQKVNFRGSERFRAAAFSIGPKGYVGTGCDYHGSLVRDFWEYNIATNTWRQKANFRGTGRQYATGFSIGDKGYIGTGGDYLTQHNDFWEYDPTTDSWKQKASVGNTTREAATGFSIGDKGYIGLGYNSNEGNKKDLWEYDPSNDTWKRKANFAGKARSAAAGFAIHQKGYIGTGTDGTSCYNDFWEYDPAADNWERVADFTGESRAYAVGFSIGNQGYIGTGGDLSGNTYKDFWRYKISATPAVTSITATPEGTSVLLNWQTASEDNSLHCSIERSKDGINFSEIGQVKSKSDFTDAKPVAGKNYYRLKQEDEDGYISYSQVANVEFNAIAGYKLYPNPVRDILYLDHLKGKATISIITQDGRTVDKKVVSSNAYAWNVKKLAAGSYYMKIEEGTKISVLKFIKQ